MSDLPDYQRNIQIVAGKADVAKYSSDPEDIPDGERGPILIDIKGRVYTLADLIKIEGAGLASPRVEGTLPISLHGYQLVWDPCYQKWWSYKREAQFGEIADPVYGLRTFLDKALQSVNLDKLLTYDPTVETLLAGGLPSALDTGALKIKEQSPLSALKIWDGTNYLATPGVGDAIGRGVFILGSNYANPTPTAKIVKVDSSGRLSCVLG